MTVSCSPSSVKRYNIRRDALSRGRPEGFLDSTKDFMLDCLGGMLEPLARTLGGKAEWDGMR
jgi:hypothetical protein